MISTEFISEFYKYIAGTAINGLVILLFYFFIYVIFVRKIADLKEKKKARARLNYILIIVFIILVIKTCFEGFTQLLALLSLISAGFVIANKELVMNLIGWLIINWRSIFSEGDYIEINDCKGYVNDLKLLYFEVFEVSKDSVTRSSGRKIKIPNGFVTIYPLKNYTINTNFLEYSITWPIPKHVDMESAKNLILRIAKATLANYYQNIKDYSTDYLQKKSKLLAKLIDLDVHTTYTLPKCICDSALLTLYYYCYPKDRSVLNESLKLQITKQLNELSELKLAKQESDANKIQLDVNK